MLRILKFHKNFSKKLNNDYKPCFLFSINLSHKASDQLYERFKGYVNTPLKNFQTPGVTIVRTKDQIEEVLKILYSIPDRHHAWDTETIDLNPKQESPVGNGKIICATAFCGPEIDFGNGPRLFIDNFGENTDLILGLKPYFEDERYRKVWHNYGFDRHIFHNHGINVRGFGGDTMHMARLTDSSRGPKEYSLASICIGYKEKLMATKRSLIEHLEQTVHGKETSKRNTLALYKKHFLKENIKREMKVLFAKKKILRDGSEGKSIEFPSIIEMHTKEELIPDWVRYSTLDAELTFFLRVMFAQELTKLQCDFEEMKTLNDIYEKYWRPFGEMLTDMERAGIKMDKQYLKKIREDAERDIIIYEEKFMNWVKTQQDDPMIDQFNPGSVLQLQQLFFAPFSRDHSKKQKKDVAKVTINSAVGDEYNDRAKSDHEDEPPEDEEENSRPIVEAAPRPNNPRKTDADDWPKDRIFKIENTKNILLEGKKKPLKFHEMKVTGLGWPTIDFTDSGLPSVDNAVLKDMAGPNPPKGSYGKIFEYYKSKNEENKGIEASLAIYNLLEFRAIETLLQTFIIPLQELSDETGRIHCSLNINTETGRLSARKPNLQNQPALEKDKYKIRLAFCADEGKKFIVADYGQLELRILAHMTDCKNMIEAFKSGGDFHSRTAISMFPKIKEEIEQGKLLLEWDKSKGPAPSPILKDKYAAERRRAKTMNFSIAYGKTVAGFAKDWNCDLNEAKESLDAWYAERKEVQTWQEQQRIIAMEKGWTQTLMGRYRNLTRYFLANTKKSFRNHGLRAAINTPIQGGAADIVMAAMVKLHQSQELRDMGWKMLLQIHDEIIFEGPQENAENALSLIKKLMENPTKTSFKVALEVDARIGNNWYESK